MKEKCLETPRTDLNGRAIISYYNEHIIPIIDKIMLKEPETKPIFVV